MLGMPRLQSSILFSGGRVSTTPDAIASLLGVTPIPDRSPQRRHCILRGFSTALPNRRTSSHTRANIRLGASQSGIPVMRPHHLDLVKRPSTGRAGRVAVIKLLREIFQSSHGLHGSVFGDTQGLRPPFLVSNPLLGSINARRKSILVALVGLLTAWIAWGLYITRSTPRVPYETIERID